jgi:hypothetical protein
MERKEGLEGADLRKLGNFLKIRDENNVLGNLYRTITVKGHVKWVCIDHYRKNYQKYSVKEFLRTLDSVGGSFNENIGRVEVRLRSRESATQFFQALGKARSVYELDIDLHWDFSTTDLEALEVALKLSRVSIIRLDLRQFRMGVTRNVIMTSIYDTIFRIRDLPDMKVLHILHSNDLVKFLEHPSKKTPPSCKVSCEFAFGQNGHKAFGVLAQALKTNSTITTLILRDSSISNYGAKSLAKALKTNKTLITLDLQHNSIGSDGVKMLAEALKTNSTLTALYLEENSIGDDGAKALAEALNTNSTLTTLDLEENSIGDDGSKALADARKINSTLTSLEL